MKKNQQLRMSMLFAIVLTCITLFGSTIIAMAEGTTDASTQERVPITVSVSSPVAGVEVECEMTPGLKLSSFERSDAVGTASITPIVEKNGKTYFGIFMAENNCVPEKGKLDIGTLIFDYSGAENQSVTITSVKFVTVIDKDNVESTTIITDDSIGVPTTGGLDVGGSNLLLWVLIVVAVVIIVVVIILARKNSNAKKSLAAMQGDSDTDIIQ